jgi:hypothetical protein
LGLIKGKKIKIDAGRPEILVHRRNRHDLQEYHQRNNPNGDEKW